MDHEENVIEAGVSLLHPWQDNYPAAWLVPIDQSRVELEQFSISEPRVISQPLVQVKTGGNVQLPVPDLAIIDPPPADVGRADE